MVKWPKNGHDHLLDRKGRDDNVPLAGSAELFQEKSSIYLQHSVHGGGGAKEMADGAVSESSDFN